ARLHPDPASTSWPCQFPRRPAAQFRLQQGVSWVNSFAHSRQVTSRATAFILHPKQPVRLGRKMSSQVECRPFTGMRLGVGGLVVQVISAMPTENFSGFGSARSGANGDDRLSF